MGSSGFSRASQRFPAGTFAFRAGSSRFPGGYPLARGRASYPGPYRAPYRGRYGYPQAFPATYGFPGVVSLGYPPPFWDFADSFSEEQSPYGAPPDASYGEGSPNAYQAEEADPYQEQAANPYQAQLPAPYPEQAAQPYAAVPADGSQPLVYAPYAYGAGARPQVSVVTLPAPLREEDAVTIFYRDGRAPEQIRNYALTRTSLLLAGEHMREIPLQEIDVPLTERVNRAAGVDFKVPQASQAGR